MLSDIHGREERIVGQITKSSTTLFVRWNGLKWLCHSSCCCFGGFAFSFGFSFLGFFVFCHVESQVLQSQVRLMTPRTIRRAVEMDCCRVMAPFVLARLRLFDVSLVVAGPNSPLAEL